LILVVGAERFELPTLWSQTRCATRLRYAPHRTSLPSYNLQSKKAFESRGETAAGKIGTPKVEESL
jgi:hypothetical protein